MNKIMTKSVILALLLCFTLCAGVSATDEVHIVKMLEDKTVLSEKTVDYTWMEENLPVQGDGVTHYFMQGPTFDENDQWNPAEDVNVLSRDLGALKGTDVKDLCDLVGGMEPGDEIRIVAEDGFSKRFGYENVYSPPARQGPMVVCWYNGDDHSEEGDQQGTGYPPDYYTGMRLAFFADTSTNPEGYHVFGNSDMQVCMDKKYWHYFNGEWPSSSGLSVKYIDEIEITTTSQEPTPDKKTGSEQSPLWFPAVLASLLVAGIIKKLR